MRSLTWIWLAVVWFAGGCAVTSDRVTDIAASPSPRLVQADPGDAEGRQFPQTGAGVAPAMMDELRERVVRYRGVSNAEMQRSMQYTGPDYTWYLSNSELQAKVGVLILTHGFREHGDRVMAKRLRLLADQRPMALAVGMSMLTSDHIQLALNNLAAAGARDIVVVPAISTRYNALSRQWSYIFGLDDTPAFATVPRVQSPARLHMVAPLEDHALVGEILLDYAAEISTHAAAEEVIIVAHGPVSPAENQAQLNMLKRLANYVGEHADYAAVSALTLQDDASPVVRTANIVALREQVSAARAAGHKALIVSNLLGTRTVQSSLRRDLSGLDYRFNAKGLSEHDNFVRWVQRSIAAALTHVQ